MERIEISSPTVIRFYNATGKTLEYTTKKKDWSGQLDKAVYRIANNQWGVFLHRDTEDSNSTGTGAAGSAGTGSTEAVGSIGAVVYRATTPDSECDWMVSWYNPKERTAAGNKVYTMIRRTGYFDKTDVWNDIHTNLLNSRNFSIETRFGFGASATIGTDAWPTLEAFIWGDSSKSP